MKTNPPGHILPVIIFAQFSGTSLWFAGNAVAGDLQQALHLQTDVIGSMTSAVQTGFIAGTLLFAILSIADRFSPVKVFVVSACSAALFNLGICLITGNVHTLLLFRFLTGFFLAGIYPVGMKISADWFEGRLGKALGYLVGALVLGTAFPHLLKASGNVLPWSGILLSTSLLATLGGVVLFLTVGDGPYRRPAPRFQWNAIPHIFQFSAFRSAAFGYFGHMWELYAMWTFIPFMLNHFNDSQGAKISVPLWSFLVISAGSIGCVSGGYFSLKSGSVRVARNMLAVSGACCLLSPLFFHLPQFFFILALLIWGFTVVGDSPQFSTIVARTAPKEYTGTALTIVNCIGFALTIGSIQLLDFLKQNGWQDWLFTGLLPGPVMGLISIHTGPSQSSGAHS